MDVIYIFFILSRITDSPLGRNLDALRQNDMRVSAIGGYTKVIKL